MGTHRSLQQTPDKVTMSATEIKLFNKYAFDEIQVNDMALTDYIACKPNSACFLPHSAGRWHKKRFKKAQCPVIERITSSYDARPQQRQENPCCEDHETHVRHHPHHHRRQPHPGDCGCCCELWST